LELADTCLGQVRLLAQQILGEDAAVVVQGSFAQGLALMGSDLDVAVIAGSAVRAAAKRSSEPRSARAPSKPPAAVGKHQAVPYLKRLAAALTEAGSPEVRVAHRIFTARVPVLRLHCRSLEGSGGEKVVVDVSVGGSLERGACDRAVCAVLRRDTSGFAAALCRLVKFWAKKRQLTNTLRGGLSSFGFVLLVVFFLQRFEAGGNLPRSLRLCPQEALPEEAWALPGGGERRSGSDDSEDEGVCPRQLQGEPLRGPECEPQIGGLLASFFRWASEDLPALGGGVLSVAKGTAEPPRLGRTAGSPGRPPVIEVPLVPGENAARCLRADIWRRLLIPELQRACRIAQRLSKPCSRSARASAVQELFSPRNLEKEGPRRKRKALLEGEESEPGVNMDDAADGEVGLLPAGLGGKVRRGKRRRDGGARGPDAEAAPFDAWGASREGKRRRRLDEATASPNARRKRDPVAVAVETAAKAAVPSPVSRWLSLRSLLNPGSSES